MTAAHYDDPHFSYPSYWQNREYEHQAETLAIHTLLKDIQVKIAADIGGGFGRLTPSLTPYAAKILLIEPARRLRQIAEKNLKSLSQISILPGSIQRTGLLDSSLDMAAVIRVFHHLPDPKPALAELARTVKPGGYLLLEFASSFHFKARIQSFLSGQPILPISIDRRSPASIRKKYIPFVNHHPQTILKLLSFYHFTPLKILSVSNFRAALIKKIMPLKLLLVLESLAQVILSRLYFGPSIFILARRVDNSSTP